MDKAHKKKNKFTDIVRKLQNIVQWISVLVAIIYVAIVVAEKQTFITNIQLLDIANLVKTYWLVGVIIVAIALINLITKSKLISSWIKHPPFSFEIDYWIVSTTISMLAYGISSNLGYTQGIFITDATKMVWFILILYCAYMLKKYLEYFFKKKGVENSKKGLFIDQPIQTSDDDILERSKFVTGIANAIRNRNAEESIVVGLYGKWGMGKSSIFNLLKENFEEQGGTEKIATVSFNPWYFENEGQLILQFFESLTTEIEKNFFGEKSELVKKLKQYSEKLSSVTIRAGFFNFSFKEFATIFKKDDDILSLRKSIEKLLEDKKQRIVVLIDDLDRLDNEETHAVLKLVKLIADFPYMAYVLALDEKVVSSVLADRFGTDDLNQMGDSFLEKIVQVPLYLPPANRINIQKLLKKGLEDILTDNQIELSQENHKRLFDDILSHSIGRLTFTVRTAKRYLNAVLFSVPLLKGEVNILDLLCLEGIRIFSPEVYKFIYEHSDAMLDNQKYRDDARSKYQSLFDDSCKKNTDYEREIIKKLTFNLFPEFGALLSGNRSSDQKSDKDLKAEQRICSKDYFEKYFVYNVPNDQISDIEFNGILELLETGEIDLAKERIESISETIGYEKLLRKFEMIEEKMSSSSAKNLGAIIANQGEALSKDLRASIILPVDRAAGLISRLLKQLSRSEQLDLMKQIVTETLPLTFAGKILEYVHPREPKEPRLLTEEEIRRLALQLIDRIKLDSKNDNFIEKHGTKTQTLLSIWHRWGDKGELQDQIRIWLKKDNGIEDFLGIFSVDSHNIYLWSIDEIYNMSEIEELLIQRGYEVPKSDLEFYQPKNLTNREQIAKTFLYRYQEYKKKVAN
ncbi:KAP family P-loop NTPase fold protein [Brevibacillus dissolubilis]|uniref:KAP family P-loop NTPase fold protein n=1 Tax=Brevibacillus dissolubilis TaxID=1844116 RepID=UPI00111710C6|nr:P-loop NTPase fold protein [Brevibacillus dissolubilis]